MRSMDGDGVDPRMTALHREPNHAIPTN